MLKKLKVALVGLDHPHAQQLLVDFSKHSDLFEFTGYSDVQLFEGSPKDKGENIIPKDINIPYFENYVDLLDAKPDIALVCTDNASHGFITQELMKRSIATVVEKPMAINLEQGMIMYRAATTYDTVLAINWPVTWHAAYRYAHELVQQGIIGTPLRFLYRNPDSLGPFSHSGKPYSNAFLADTWWYKRERGGGAMLDYCGYGCMMATWFLNSHAISAYGVRAIQMDTFAEVEDYSTMTICFEKSIALLEGSWATRSNGGIPTGPILFGTEGTLVTDRYSNLIKVYRTFHKNEPDEIYEAPPLSTGIALEMYNCLVNGTELHPTLSKELNIKALAILDAGIRSCESRKMEYVENPFLM